MTRPAVAPSVDELQALVRDAASARTVALDESYTLTAFVVERDPGRPLVVELLDYGPAAGDRRWTVSAYDELCGAATGLTVAATAAEALRGLD